MDRGIVIDLSGTKCVANVIRIRDGYRIIAKKRGNL